jgi:DtxR family transcriptional regulator, Mn-dependent transcriptional regulator
MAQSKALPALSSAMEDYLEVIYHLEQEKRIARVRDIAGRLGVKMSSVSAALKTLGARGLIRYDPHQFITLTDRGINKAKEIVRKHEVLKSFLVRILQVNEPVAEDNACRIEHHLDPEVIDKLIRFVEFVETCPVDQTRWMDKRSQGCEDCGPCLEDARVKLMSRAQAQKAALEDGLTLAEASAGSQVMIDRIKAAAKIKKSLSEQGLLPGAIVGVERHDEASGALEITIKGYHLTLPPEEASKILIKPI